MSQPYETTKAQLELAKFASVNGMRRYAIGGVLLERKGQKEYLVATDGKRLISISRPSEGLDNCSAIIPLSEIKALQKDLKAKDTGTMEALPGERVMLGVKRTDKSWSCAQIEGTFPDWRQVVPSETPEIKVTFNPKLLGEALIAISKIMGGNEHDSVTLELTKPNRPLKITAKAPSGNITAVVMPIAPK